MDPTPGLNAGLLIGRDHKFIVLERLAFPLPLVEIQDPAGLGRKLRVAGENPAAVLSGANGILVQPAPQGGLTQLRHQAALTDMPGEFLQTPAGERHILLSRQFACQVLNLHDQFWGERTGTDPVGDVLPGPPGVP